MRLLNQWSDWNFTPWFVEKGVSTTLTEDAANQQPNVLNQLQEDILFREPRRLKSLELEQDESLIVLACANPRREVEAVASLIWDWIRRDPDLRLNECAVIVHDMNLYQHQIEQVFESIGSSATRSSHPRKSTWRHQMSMNDGKFDLPYESPVVPRMLEEDSDISFSCYPGISCFNACCKQADITLAPYDVIRLKKRLGMDSSEFLKKHTVPYEMDQHGMPGIKLRTLDDSPVCTFMTDKGCSVYEDRPTACRYYPLGLLSMKKKDEKSDEVHYALVEEEHCKGHCENRKLTVGEYRKEQGVIEYDEMNRDWHRIILKKRSAGPAIGTPPEMSFQLFFMASYDLDRFRRFVLSESFSKMYDLDEAFYDSVREDDEALLKFGYKLMMQVFFGEMSVPMVDKAVEKRLAERGEVIAMRHEAEKKAWQEKQEKLKRESSVGESEPVVNVCGEGGCGAND